jgi:hypothetical protein
MGEEQGERLSISRATQRAHIDRIETDIADEHRGGGFPSVCVAAIHHAWRSGFAARLEYAKEHFAWNVVESGDDLGAWHSLRQRLGARDRVTQNEFGVFGVERQRTTDNHLARKIPA